MVIVQMQTSREQVQRCLRSGEVVQRCRSANISSTSSSSSWTHKMYFTISCYSLSEVQRCRDTVLRYRGAEVQQCSVGAEEVP